MNSQADHLRPYDGLPCDYLSARGVCNKCGWFKVADQPTPSDELRERVDRVIIKALSDQYDWGCGNQEDEPDADEVCRAIHDLYRPLISPAEGERAVMELGDGNYALPTTCPTTDDGDFAPPVSLHFVPLEKPRPVGTECPDVGTHGDQLDRDKSVCEIVFKSEAVARLVVEDLVEAFAEVGWVIPSPALTEEEREELGILFGWLGDYHEELNASTYARNMVAKWEKRLLNEGSGK